MKRIYRILLVAALICSIGLGSVGSVSAVGETTQTSRVNNRQSMGSLDVMLAAFRFLSMDDKNEDIWGRLTGVKEYKELYDLSGNVRAYYISFEPTGFIVINNNYENPIAIEYSKGDCPYFVGENAQSRIAENTVYVSPMGFLASNDVSDAIYSKNNTDILKKTDDFYSWLDVPNYEEMHHQIMLMSQLEASQVRPSATRGTYADYNMIASVNLTGTGGSVTERLGDIYSISNWGTYNEFLSSTVYNHCVSVAAFNLILYYRYSILGLSTTGTNRTGNFNTIHGYIGNGPKLLGDMANGLTTYFSYIGNIHFYDSYGGISYSTFKTGISQNKMGAYTLFGGVLVGFHTVIGVGYREYTSGQKYINIVTGWDNSLDYWIASGSDWGSYQMWCTA